MGRQKVGKAIFLLFSGTFNVGVDAQVVSVVVPHFTVGSVDVSGLTTIGIVRTVVR